MALLGLAGRGFFPAPLVGFSPLPITLGSGKVCWNVILLEYCAGEPHDSRHHDCDKWVYPCVCGGTVVGKDRLSLGGIRGC